MLSNLKPQPADKILHITQLFRADPRAEKVDLGVGVYKDATGHTPVMRAVRAAEKRLAETQPTKAYTALAGDPAYLLAMAKLVLGGDRPLDRIAAAATPGGTGALHQALELAHAATPGATLWIPEPTWPNHPSIARHLGITHRGYRYFDTETGEVDEAGLLADLAGVAEGDIVLLHGCCHNPTGANPTAALWDRIADLLLERKAVALVDIAYQGFGDGIEEDAAATRLLVSRLPEVLIAASCSKNFGLYRDRAGIVFAVAADSAARDLAQDNLAALNRVNYSFAPDHGARIVTMILEDKDLRADWEAELRDVRDGMLALREQLAAALRTATNSDRFDFVARHRGMFSRLGLTQAEVLRLRAEFAIYMVDDSRFNVAGLNAESVPRLASAVAEVLREARVA